MLVDPPFSSDGKLQELPGRRIPIAALLTNHFHIRSAGGFRTEFGCDVYMHAAEESWTDFRADHYFSDNDLLQACFRAIRIPNSNFSGATAFLFESGDGILFVGEAIDVRDSKTLWKIYTRYLARTCSTVEESIEELKVLLDHQFDALLPAHDEPMLTGAKTALREFLANPITRY
ncbi:MAG: MBL fold metallo-hydrolase [Chloroflexi bacterium]|nr:MBL fold metallo-hydrolase [Chloroflexota bacterium]